MAIAVEQFINGLEENGIISSDKLRAVREKLPPDRQQDAQELARELVRQKVLTKYQAREAYQGNAKHLVLGNYTLLEQIGQGGMGQVFKAEHRRMHRTVAIKMLPTAMTKDLAAIARFEREVTAAAKLRHPNIVAADDADCANGKHFLVMECVDGQDLSALVKKNEDDRLSDFFRNASSSRASSGLTAEQSLAVTATAHAMGQLGTAPAGWKHWARLKHWAWRWKLAGAAAAGALPLAGVVWFLATRPATLKSLAAKAPVAQGDPVRPNPSATGKRKSPAKAREAKADTVPEEQPLPAVAPFDATQAGAHQEAWAKHLGTKVEIENSLGMKLRLIPPGEFEMGSPRAEIDALVQSTGDEALQSDYRTQGPRHRVKLTKAFYLGSCEVTQRQYQELMDLNPSHFASSGPGKDVVRGLDTAGHPVEMVNWYDAIDFCNKLSEQERLSPYYAHDGDQVKILGGGGRSATTSES